MCNGFRDVNNIKNGNFNKVGTQDFLRDNFYRPLGEAVFDSKYGDTAGDIVYLGLDFASGIKVGAASAKALKGASEAENVEKEIKPTLEMNLQLFAEKGEELSKAEDYITDASRMLPRGQAI